MDDHGLPEHIPMLRATLRRFVEAEMPREAARRWDDEDSFPRDVLTKLAGLGLLGTTTDERYGGAGVDILATMVTIALVIANLTASVRQQTRVAGARERRTALLYAMSRELGGTRGTPNMARVAVRHVAEVFQCQAVVLLPEVLEELIEKGLTPWFDTEPEREKLATNRKNG